jgi:hypothetical protein
MEQLMQTILFKQKAHELPSTPHDVTPNESINPMQQEFKSVQQNMESLAVSLPAIKDRPSADS